MVERGSFLVVSTVVKKASFRVVITVVITVV